MLSLEEILTELGRGAEEENGLITTIDRWRAAMYMRDFAWVYSRASGRGTWCSACMSQIEPEPLHLGGGFLRCPACGKLIERKEEWRGHKYLRDARFIYIWKKSAADPETVLVKCVYAEKEYYCEHPESAPLQLKVEAIWQFGPGCAKKYTRNYYAGKDVFTPTARGMAPEERKRFGVEAHHIGAEYALMGTRIGAVALHMGLNWRGNPARYDPIEVVAGVAKRPYLEYVLKQGQEQLARDILFEHAPVRKPRAKTLRQLLGLTEGQMYEIKRDGIALTGRVLLTLHAVQDAGAMTLRISEAEEIAARCSPYQLSYLKGVMTKGLLERCPPKLRRKAVRRATRDGLQIQTWVDYWRQLDELGEDLTDSAIVAPKDLDGMHQRMTDRINMRKNEERARMLAEKQERLRANLPALRREYAFEAHGLRLEPYSTAKAVWDEGTNLHICIGSYAERYLDGDTILCSLRRADAPDVPWRAVEFSATTGRLVQDRGAYNDAGKGIHNKDDGVRELLEAFWAAFEDWRASKKRRIAQRCAG